MQQAQTLASNTNGLVLKTQPCTIPEPSERLIRLRVLELKADPLHNLYPSTDEQLRRQAIFTLKEDYSLDGKWPILVTKLFSLPSKLTVYATTSNYSVKENDGVCVYTEDGLDRRLTQEDGNSLLREIHSCTNPDELDSIIECYI